ncbi:SH3 domain-containing YSC84-like protein 1 [Cytospora mali]|uniref:SH3 domain-containing YSC84-like protein 1 n=1 Tax=Cytospora mali TaxID=578113 RepID=A0A194V0A3_CYTMA|nr:SH3 domain-containing YSC84-like protein 1 [Valsa mali var. pyri (nom. inval.)]
MSGSQDHNHQNPDYYAETASLYGAHGQQAQDQAYPPPGQGQGYAPQQQPSPGNPSVSQPPASGTGDQAYMDTSKPTFKERLYQWSTKAGVPINKVTNRLGSEAFWPSTMEIECDKAARILKSFCKDGFYTEDKAAATVATSSSPSPSTGPVSPGPRGKPKVLVKIPQKAIETAAGLAIFTTFRTGLHISGAGGSGIAVSRLPDGSWSPPSGFLVHTLGAGFMIGLDIYDCVCILRTKEAVEAFTNPRISLGGEVGLVAGPVGAGAAVDAALLKSTKPVWSYMKSRGFYAGVQADGTIIIARPDANAAFYGVKGVKVKDILQGHVPTKGPPGMWPEGARQLMEVLKSAEGRGDVDEGVLKDVSAGPTPGDLGLDDQGHATGVYVPDGKQTRYA